MTNEITIPVKYYIELIEDQIKLNCLEQYGVDEWEGWNNAIDLFKNLVNKKQEIEDDFLK